MSDLPRRGFLKFLAALPLIGKFPLSSSGAAAEVTAPIADASRFVPIKVWHFTYEGDLTGTSGWKLVEECAEPPTETGDQS